MPVKKRKQRSLRAEQVLRKAEGATLDLAHAKKLLRAMQQELTRHKKGLKQPGEPAPFFLSYLLHAKEGLTVWGRYGSVFRAEPQRDSDLYAEVRLGSHRFDNSIDGGIASDSEKSRLDCCNSCASASVASSISFCPPPTLTTSRLRK